MTDMGNGKGYFISFEGVDGSGKSTQIDRVKMYLEERGMSVVLTREPGGSRIGEEIRKLLLDPGNGEMTALTEALLYAASRAQHVEQVIMPAISAGKVVLCDRFLDSSIAYQGYGRGLGDTVKEINREAVRGCVPDMTFFMRVRPDVGAERMAGREKDRIEHEEVAFHSAVYRGYEELERQEPERIIGIDASGSVEDVFDEIRRHIDRLLTVREHVG